MSGYTFDIFLIKTHVIFVVGQQRCQISAYVKIIYSR